MEMVKCLFSVGSCLFYVNLIKRDDQLLLLSCVLIDTYVPISARCALYFKP